MKKLVLAIYLLASVSLLGQTAQIGGQITQAVTFTATPTFNATTANTFVMTLTGAVTSSTFIPSFAGQTVTFVITQDGTGSRTFVWPTNVVSAPTIKSAANATTVLTCRVDSASNCQPLDGNFTDGYFVVPPAACFGATTGTAGAGNDTIVLDGSVPALKVSATNASGSHEVFTCVITVPSRLTAGKGVTITDITYLYSVQTTTATSMVASTLNTFTAPAAGASETASSATLVAAGGSLTQTPVVASANLTSVSAGQYYSEKVALGTPFTVTTDLQPLVFTFEIDQSASAAQIVTTPGLVVHYQNTPL